MTSRTGLKKRKGAEATTSATTHTPKGAAGFRPGSTMRTILEQMERNEGIIKVKNKASYDGRGIDLNAFVSCLHILANPLHPENRWSCLVEMVKYDDEAYLRLVPSIPIEVKRKWEATGKPPRQMAINDVQEMISVILGGGGIRQGIASYPRHPKNPFRDGGNYARLVDIIAAAGPRGIDEESWIQACCEVSGKARDLVKNDLGVVKSAMRGPKRHKSCRSGFTIVEHGGRYSIRFD